MLCRVYVDIHLAGIELQIQDEGTMRIGRQTLAVSLAHRMIEQFIAHHTAVHVGVLHVRLSSSATGRRQPPPQTQAKMLAIDFQC